MAEFRRDPLLGNWVVVGFKKTKTNVVGMCPFCPGNEELTPPSIREVRDAEGHWLLRCFSASNPLFIVEEEANKRAEGFYDKMGTLGADELIVESPIHTKSISAFEPEEMARVVAMYTERIADLKKDERFKYVQIFKNHGEIAGSYIFHPHSHVLATPILPNQITQEIANSRNHYLLKERCLICDVVSQEERQEKRVVTLTDHFMVLCPFASRVPFEVWIIPRAHNPAFERWDSTAVQADFVRVFLDTMKRIEKCASAYSIVIHTSPSLPRIDLVDDHVRLNDYFHWHIEIMPRDANSAKFKREDQFYAIYTTPEEAAILLKAEKT
jgi:UDPglucose--hexose-1-phosphate uridylyltransferase